MSDGTPQLEVTEEDGQFMCMVKGACGSPVCGYGKSVLEAVGNWAIYSSTMKIVCNPPELLEKFAALQVVGYQHAPRRD